MFRGTANPAVFGEATQEDEWTLTAKVCPEDSCCTRFFWLAAWRFSVCEACMSPRSTQESHERPAGNEDCQGSRWQHRIRLLGNLVFGTGLRQLVDFLKSCGMLSEKHGADIPAKSAECRFSPTGVNLTRMQFISCFPQYTCSYGVISGDVGFLSESFRVRCLES